MNAQSGPATSILDVTYSADLLQVTADVYEDHARYDAETPKISVPAYGSTTTAVLRSSNGCRIEFHEGCR